MNRWVTCPIVNGRAWALGLDVTADLLLPPAGAVNAAQAALAELLLTPIDPTFPTRFQRGDILVAGGGFAAGTTDDRAVRAMLGAGVGAVVACSFDATFARAALERGLLAVEVNEALVVHTGARLRVDLEAARVVNMSSGDRYPIRNATDAMLERFRALAAD